MSSGKLKPEYNRVRTSVALQGNEMWNTVIGLNQEAQTGSNAVIEARLQAPRRRGGPQARREAARALMTEAGYSPSVDSFEGLVALAKAQGNLTGSKRGACRICGGMGHTTKQCKNHLSAFYEKIDEGGNEGAIEALPVVHEGSEISSLSSNSDSQQRRHRKHRKRHSTSKEDRKKRRRVRESKEKEFRHPSGVAAGKKRGRHRRDT